MEHERLSIARCRNLLGGTSTHTDDDVMKIRDSLYGLAEIVADAYQEFKAETGEVDPFYLLPEHRIYRFQKLLGMDWGEERTDSAYVEALERFWDDAPDAVDRWLFGRSK